VPWSTSDNPPYQLSLRDTGQLPFRPIGRIWADRRVEIIIPGLYGRGPPAWPRPGDQDNDSDGNGETATFN
jgi:hypothetical protein